MRYVKLSLRTISLVLMGLSLVTYILLSFVFLKYRDFVDEPSTLMPKYLSTASGGPLAPLKYPVGLLPLIHYLGLQIGYVTLTMGCLAIILTYLLTYHLTKDPLKAGLSSIILATTAGFVYWFKFNTYGSYVLLPLWLLMLLLFIRIEDKFNVHLLAVIFILNGLFWLTSVFGWITLLLYSFYLSIKMFQGIYNKKYLMVGLVLLASTLPLNIVTNVHYITEHHVFSIMTLTLILALYVILVKKTPMNNPLVSLLFSIIPYVTSLSIIASGLLSEPPGLVENYVKKPTPLIDYGVVGLLAIPTLVYVVKNRLFRQDRRGLTFILLIALFLVSLCLSYRYVIYSLMAIASFTPILASSLLDVLRWIYSSIGSKAIFRYMIVSWLIAGVLVNNVLFTITALNIPPATIRLDLPEIYYRLVVGNESALLKAFETISQKARGRVILLCYWDYIYYAKGVLGDKLDVSLYSNMDEYRRFFSQILLSEEGVAYGLIKNKFGGLNNTEIYIVIVELVSFEGGFNESRIVDVGVVGYAESLVRPGFYDRTYWVFSDIGRVYLYTQFGGLNYSDYIFPMTARINEIPLSWTENMGNTLLVKLFTYGLTSRGYDVYNYVRSKERPISVTLTTGGFELVDTIITPLFTVRRQIGGYVAEHEVCYYVAIYKVKL